MINTIKKEQNLVIAFDTTTMAYLMERLRREDNLEGRLIPLPKSIDAGCGAAFATKKIDEKFWTSYMKEKSIEYRLIKIMEI